MTSNERIDIDAIIGNLLRYGVIISTAFIMLGLSLVIVKQPADYPTSLEQLIATNYGRPILDPAAILQGAGALNPISILVLGTLILLATPIARVAVSVFLFLAERDTLYVLITLFVLTMLFVGIFVVGSVGA